MYDDTQSEWLYSKGWSDPEQLEIIAVRTESIGWTFGDLWKRWRGDTSYIYLEEVMKKDKTVILFVHLFYGLISILCFGFLITSSLVRTFAYDHWSRIEQHLNGLRHDEVVAFK